MSEADNPSRSASPSTDSLELLECASRAVGVSFDRLLAKRSLAEAERTWPGEDREALSKRLLEVGESLGIRFQEVERPLRDAFRMIRPGAPLLTFAHDERAADRWLILGEAKGRRLQVVGHVGEGERWLSTDQFRQWVGADSKDTPIHWITAQAALGCQPASQSHDPHDREEAPTPFARTVALFLPERSDLWVVFIFAIFVGILALATPIAVEALVNTVAFGRFLQPVIVLSILLFAFLAFAASLQVVQTYIVELMKRRLFVRVVADLSFRLPRARRGDLDGVYGPELVNRFFAVVSVQATAASLILDALSIVLQTVIGMAVLAFYHPFLLGFDVVLLLLIAITIFGFGRNAVATAVVESRTKYAAGAWLEELVRNPIAFRHQGGSELALEKADQLACDYLIARRAHFRIVLRQIILALSLQVVASTVLLGLGGWLVITGQLTLGQLVAAELIVTVIVGSFAKMGKHLESFYDLLASVEKLGHLFDLSIETHDNYFHPHHDAPAALSMREVSFAYANGRKVLDGIDLEVAPGESMALLGRSGSGKSTLIDLAFDMRQPTAGRIELDGVDLNELRSDSVRECVSLARSIEIFQGSVAENVHLYRPQVGIDDVRQLLEHVGLLEEVMQLPAGLDHPLTTGGAPLSENQARRLTMARAMANQPRLLLFDGILDPLGDPSLDSLFERLLADDAPWTLLITTSRLEIAERCNRIYELSAGGAASASRGRELSSGEPAG